MIDNNSIGKQAIAHATSVPVGYGPEVSRGVIVGYIDRPMVLIEEANGQKFWWIAEQTEVIESGK